MDATDTITLNPRLFANLPPANKVYDAPVESLPTLANKIDFIAELVERNWQELPDSLKELAEASSDPFYVCASSLRKRLDRR